VEHAQVAADRRRRLRLYLTNGGKGPALNTVGSMVAPADIRMSVNPTTQSIAATESERIFEWWFFERVAPAFPLVDIGIELRYFDVSGRGFLTRIDFKVGDKPDYGVSSVEQRASPARKHPISAPVWIARVWNGLKQVGG
jgi:hypothetical protein